MAAQRREYGPAEFKTFPTGASKTTAIDIGDAVFYDETNDVAVSAADFGWKGSEIRTQRAYARVHLGFSMDARGKTDSGNIRVSKMSVVRLPCASATIAKDDFVCLEKASGNALEAQKVQTTPDGLAAIGRSLEKGTSVTVFSFEQEGAFERPRPQNQRTHIADPGASGAIPVVGYVDGICMLVTAAAESRTVADPTHVGQRLTLFLDTDGGDCTVTFASDITQTSGENVATFGDVGDYIMVEAISVSGTAKWRLVGATATQQGVAIT